MALDDESRRGGALQAQGRRPALTFGAGLRSLSQRMSGHGSVTAEGTGDCVTSLAFAQDVENYGAVANVAEAKPRAQAGSAGKAIRGSRKAKPSNDGGSTPQQPSIMRFFQKQGS